MKVYIGPYKNWFGPYQLAEVLCFLARKQPDEFGIMRKPDWVHSFGEWLAHGSIEPEQAVGEVRDFARERKNTLLYKFLLWVDSKKERKVKVHIDRWDAYSAYHTIALVVLPILKDLAKAKNGAPHVDDEDVPEHLRSTSAPPKQDKYDIDDNHFKRWDYVLDEMIFAFEHILDESWEDEFYSGQGSYKTVKREDGNFELLPEGSRKVDFEGLAKVNERIKKGTTLFGKYYQSLWW